MKALTKLRAGAVVTLAWTGMGALLGAGLGLLGWILPGADLLGPLSEAIPTGALLGALSGSVFATILSLPKSETRFFTGIRTGVAGGMASCLVGLGLALSNNGLEGLVNLLTPFGMGMLATAAGVGAVLATGTRYLYNRAPNALPSGGVSHGEARIGDQRSGDRLIDVSGAEF